MDEHEYLFQSGFQGHQNLIPKGASPPIIQGGRGLYVDSRRGKAIVSRPWNVPGVPVEAVEEVCCPEESPFSLDMAWAFWKEQRLTAAHVGENMPVLFPGTNYSKFCLRFVWVCSCEDEQFCRVSVLNDNPKSLLGPDDYKVALSTIAPTSPCISSLYVFQFYGTKILNPAYVDPTTTPDVKRRLFTRGSAYRVYLLNQAHLG